MSLCRDAFDPGHPWYQDKRQQAKVLGRRNGSSHVAEMPDSAVPSRAKVCQEPAAAFARNRLSRLWPSADVAGPIVPSCRELGTRVELAEGRPRNTSTRQASADTADNEGRHASDSYMTLDG